MEQAAVEAAFIAYLLERRWDVTTTSTEDVDHLDHVDPVEGTNLFAKRGAELLLVECEGDTSAPVSAVEAGYGRLLRRMTPATDGATCALVVPEALATAAAEVAAAIRGQLRIEIYLVSDFGGVRLLPD